MFSGVSEICEKAGVPKPSDRIERTSKASSARLRNAREAKQVAAKGNLRSARFADELEEFTSEYATDEAEAKLSDRGMVRYASKYLAILDRRLYDRVRSRHQDLDDYLEEIVKASPSFKDAVKRSRLQEKREPSVAAYLVKTVADYEKATEIGTGASIEGGKRMKRESASLLRYEPQTDASRYLKVYIEMCPGMRKDIQDRVLKEVDWASIEFDSEPMLLFRLLQLGGYSNHKAELVTHFWLRRMRPKRVWITDRDEFGQVENIRVAPVLSDSQREFNKLMFLGWLEKTEKKSLEQILWEASRLRKFTFSDDPHIQSEIDGFVRGLKPDGRQVSISWQP